ncbi:hypothetical protein [Flavobacterium sp.]|uniref:hypothetical protein n=1 Tax=Flavobacterium sp. TaxID=239 RepID=UPI0026307A70|nr:hypothetical protein [Flavobacterium sp.]
MTKNIAILSTVVNFDLYQKSAPLFPKGIQKYLIDGRNGMHAMDSVCYMFKKLKDQNIDWLIMADEDVLFINPDLVFPIIQRMEQEQYTVCGVRDGGVIPHRVQNPFAINTFFSIINFKEISQIWNEDEVLKHQFIVKDEFKDDLSQVPGDYSKESLFEPYYCFYFWLRRQHKKILFLDASVPFEDDAITNLVFDDQGNKMLYHTWYARSYGSNDKHTKRINAIFDKALKTENTEIAPIIFKDPTYAFKKNCAKQYAKVVVKLKSMLKK